MPYTHADVEADRKRPVGSLFVQLMDKPHCAYNKNNTARAGARARGCGAPPSARGRRAAPHDAHTTHTLANTTLSRYVGDAHGGDAAHKNNKTTPLRGRRHYDVATHFDIGYENVDDTNDSNNNGHGNKPMTARRHTPRGPPEQLGSDLRPLHSPPPTPRQRRRVCAPGTTHTPRGDGNGDNVIVHGGDDAHAVAPPRHRGVEAARHLQCDDHLGLSTLLPREEVAKPRPVPPPLVLPPRHTGIRMFPARSAQSVRERRRGVRIVGAPPHYRSVAERQHDFLALRVVTPRRRPSSSPRRTAIVPTAAAAAEPTQRYRLQRCNNNNAITNTTCGDDAAAATTTTTRGRSRAAVPPTRAFNIITGLPISA